MSLEIMSQVWTLSGMPPAHKLVLLYLADRAHDDGTRAYPGVDRLVERSGLGRRRVQEILRDLEAWQFVAAPDTRGGRGRATEYTVQPGKGALPAKGAICDRKGRNLRQERVRPSSPQPSGTVQEPSKARDLLFEAVCQTAGKDWHGFTAAERTGMNKVVGQLRQAGATPDEVKARAARWPQVFPGARFTEWALVNHWSRLVPEAKPRPHQCPPHRWADMGEDGRYCLACKTWEKEEP